MTLGADELLRHYLQRFHNAAQTEQTRERIPFEVDQRIIGSVGPADAQLIANRVAGVELTDDSLEVLPVCAPDAPAALQAIAQVLRDAGLVPSWRDEQLPVCADDGTLVGSIERGCVRTLGIRTYAVHLSGQCNDDRNGTPEQTHAAQYAVWLQRRAADKAVDPGKLDTLAGGLIGMENGKMEPLRLGLQREVSEEAGLEPVDYDNPIHIDTIPMRWHLSDGFFAEDCIVYHARLKTGAPPVNRDGEVSEFLRVDRAGLLSRINAGELTEAAAIASLLALRHVESRAS